MGKLVVRSTKQTLVGRDPHQYSSRKTNVLVLLAIVTTLYIVTILERDKAKRVGVYMRVSTTAQEVVMQEFELRRYAEARGWKIYNIYSDRGISGRREDRPALQELMAAW